MRTYSRGLVIWKIAKEICINGKKCSFVPSFIYFHLLFFFFSRARLIAAAATASQAIRRIAHFVQATMRTIAKSENKAGHSLRHFSALSLTLVSALY